ncbi:MAG: DUF4388 domain-containing protein [Polyangia bacterium]
MPGQRVLVVDDNQGFREQVVSAIAATGLQVHGIARGSEALRLCASLLPDLLIVDLVRPASEGHWLIERLLRRGDETPLGPPPQAVLALVPIGGDFSDLPDGVDLQVKPMFASQVLSLAQRLLLQLPGPVSRPPFDPATTAPISATGPTAPVVPTLPTAPTVASGRPPVTSRPTPPRSSRAQAEEVPIAVEHVAPPRGYRSRDRFEEESSDFDPGQTLLAPVSMQELARSMNRSADEMMAITVAGRPSDPGQSGEEIEIIESDGGDGGDAETADTHPRFDVELRLNPMGTPPAAPPVPPPLQDPSGSVPASLLSDPSGALRLSQSEPPSTLSGDLAGIALLDIVALLARQGQTGLLRITATSKQQQIDCVLRKGRLEQATATGFPALRLGRFVLELDTLRQPEIDAVAARGAGQQTGPHQRSDQDATQVLDIGPGGLLGERASPAPRAQELLGVRLMAAGLLKREELQQALSRQSAELLFEALRMGRGRFRFLRTTELPQLALDPQLGGGLSLDIEALLLEAVRRQDAWQQVDRDATEGAVYVSQVKTPEELQKIGLAPAESAVLLLCTGRTGLADIARESRLPLAEVQKALQRLQSLGLVRRRLPAVLAS